MKNKSIFFDVLALFAMLFIYSNNSATAQIYPHGGVGYEQWKAGSTAIVRWDTALFSGTLRIKLWDGIRSVNTTITDSVPASVGMYSFMLSPSLLAGNKYRVKVIEVDSPYTISLSDSYFSIAPFAPIAFNPTSKNDDSFRSNYSTAKEAAQALFSTNPLESSAIENNMGEVLSDNSKTIGIPKEDNDIINPKMIFEQIISDSKTFRINRLYPQPAINGDIIIDAESNENVNNIKAVFYTIAGQKIATLWEGNLKKGTSTIMMALSGIASGSYILCLKNNNNEVVDYKQVIVADMQR